MIDRRTLLCGFTAAFPASAWARAEGRLARAAWEAALFSFSIGEMARAAAATPARNRLGHRRTLSDHRNRAVTMPNNDTLYSSCWLTLPPGAYADFDIPVNAERYVSAALMSMDTDVVALESSPGQSSSNGRIRIVGPGWQGGLPRDRRLVRSPSEDAWVLIRTSVDGPGGLAAAQAVQAQIGLTVTGAPETPRASAAPLADPADQLRSQVNSLLARTDPDAPLASRSRQHRRFGIGNLFEPRPEDDAAWRKAVASLHAAEIGDITDHGRLVSGWHWPNRNIAQYGNDERFRAAVALSGFGALPEREAIYLTAMRDASGLPLAPGKTYRIDFGNPPPVNAFWSLSAYRGEPDGRFFFVSNPIERYSVGSKTPGMEQGGTIIAAPSAPADRRAVWLPIVDGPFRLVLRCYLPDALLLNRTWIPPAITPIS